MSEPFIITEDEYNHDKMSWGKKDFIVYDNVCTPPVILYTLDDKTMEGFIGKELLIAAKEMAPDERMYVRNPEMEMDIELLRAEGEYIMQYQEGNVWHAINGNYFNYMYTDDIKYLERQDTHDE